MEKTEAIKEWAFEQAQEVTRASGRLINVEQIIADARKIEAYINSKREYPVGYVCDRCGGWLESLYVTKGGETVARVICPKCDKVAQPK